MDTSIGIIGGADGQPASVLTGDWSGLLIFAAAAAAILIFMKFRKRK